MLRAATSTPKIPFLTTTAKKPSKLNDRELVVLESTLRVQLQVSKCVRMAKVTGAVGAVALRGPLAAIPSGFSIVNSQFQRNKLKKRHRKVRSAMDARGLIVALGADDAARLGTRAYAISMATGLACCVLAFSADILIDRAVVQVVSEAAMGYADELIVGSLTTHMAEQLTPGATVAVATTKEPPQPPPPQQLESKTRSPWSGLMAKWTASRAKKQAEDAPPDLFGEQDASSGVPPTPRTTPQLVEVQRSDEFALFGECLVVRFTPPAEPDDRQQQRVGERERQVEADVVPETGDVLSETQWRSLWTPEDGPGDVVDLDDQVDDDCDCDLFGTETRRAETSQVRDFDLFGASTGEESHGNNNAFDLFGLHAAAHEPRG